MNDQATMTMHALEDLLDQCRNGGGRCEHHALEQTAMDARYLYRVAATAGDDELTDKLDAAAYAAEQYLEQKHRAALPAHLRNQR